MSDARQNLVEGVRFEEVEGDILQGDGSELRGDGRGRPPKFLAAHSSTALAVNVFGPYKKAPSTVRMPWGGPFTSLDFERKCPHGVGKGKPPNLDVLLEGSGGGAAIESKRREPIGDHKAEFKPVYDADLKGARRETPWFRELKRLTANASAYNRLNAAQLVKHALGLAFSFPDRSTTLAYLFWEPSNAEEHPLFSEHNPSWTASPLRSPAAARHSYGCRIRNSGTGGTGPQGAPELRAHVSHLRKRYDFAVDQAVRSRALG